MVMVVVAVVGEMEVAVVVEVGLEVVRRPVF